MSHFLYFIILILRPMNNWASKNNSLQSIVKSLMNYNTISYLVYLHQTIHIKKCNSKYFIAPTKCGY